MVWCCSPLEACTLLVAGGCGIEVLLSPLEVRLEGDAPTLASAEGLNKNRKSSHADFMKLPKKPIGISAILV